MSGEATILVFMELTLQLDKKEFKEFLNNCHNPCFYGINFAIKIRET